MPIKISIKPIIILSIFFYLIIQACNSDELESTIKLDVAINWTAYKFPIFAERDSVSGSFQSFDYLLLPTPPSSSIIEKLRGAEMSITCSSLKVGNDSVKASNIAHYFFNYFSTFIHCKVKSITNREAKITVTMNGISQDIILQIFIDEENYRITFKGKIEDLNNFNAQFAFSKLDEICGEYHQGYVWPDVKLEIIIENYNLLE